MKKITGFFLVVAFVAVVALFAAASKGTAVISRTELSKPQVELAEMFVFPFLASYEISGMPAGRDIEWAFEHYAAGEKSAVISSGGLTTMRSESIRMLFSIQDVLGSQENFMSISFRTQSGTAIQNKVFGFPEAIIAYGWKAADKIAIPDEGEIIVVAGIMSSSSLVPVDSKVFSGSSTAFDELMRNEHVFLLRLSFKESTLYKPEQ